jgi:DNA-binding response OmpR family regulator
MALSVERILVVESDPDVSDLIARQALKPLGYQINVATDAASAIRLAVQAAPDLIISNLMLPGLSGKDLLVALSSQGISAPFIVLANKGSENDVIQAFRLGAADYITLPVRETEVVVAVERALKQTREGRAREQLDRQLKQTNAELQRRVRELTTIFTIGRAVISITDLRVLFEKIVEGAAQVSEADMGWLSLRDEKTHAIHLSAHLGLPEAWAKKMNQPLDDGMGGLVSLSGETLSINGEPLKQFKIAQIGRSAVVVPIKAQNEVIGLLAMVRKADRPFDQSVQSLLEALADYASISLVNAQLFRALASSADAAQKGEKRRYDRFETLRREIQEQVQTAQYPLQLLLSEQMGTLTSDQKAALNTLRVSLERMAVLTSREATKPLRRP